MSSNWNNFLNEVDEQGAKERQDGKKSQFRELRNRLDAQERIGCGVAQRAPFPGEKQNLQGRSKKKSMICGKRKKRKDKRQRHELVDKLVIICIRTSQNHQLAKGWKVSMTMMKE